LVKIEFLENEIDVRYAAERLSTQMEADRPNAWCVDEMGERYQKLLPAIVAFRAHIKARQVKFKLGQNERMPELEQALDGLECEGREEIMNMMKQANRARLIPA
jgi:transcriptional regulator